MTDDKVIIRNMVALGVPFICFSWGTCCKKRTVFYLIYLETEVAGSPLPVLEVLKQHVCE